jgi:hypothetical protein
MTLEDSAKAMGRCHHEGDTAHALFAAVAQIALAMRESQDPVAELGSLLARQAETLAAVRASTMAHATAQQSAHAPDPASGANVQPPTASQRPPTEAASAAALRALLDQLQADVFKGVQQMQFYDRLVQHLTHVQDYLIAIASELDSFKAPPHSQQFWDALHSKFRRRLISDEQRGLLDLFIMPDTATPVSAQAKASPDYSPPGSFEMF